MNIVSQLQKIPVLLSLTVIAAVGLTGCSPITTGKSAWKKLPWVGEKEPKPYPNPQKMAVTWAPDVIMRTGATPTRGFGGRVFFYDEKTRPVPVDGELAVQAFIPGPDGKPQVMKRYGFTAEQFTRHYSQSDLGGSYSIWIPWDALGGDETKITLIPSFRTKEGKTVSGTASIVLLPGQNNHLSEPQFKPVNGELFAEGTTMRPRAWTNKNGSPELFRRSGLTTTTIPVRQSRQRGSGAGMSDAHVAIDRTPRHSNVSAAQPPASAAPAAMPFDIQPASATSPIPATTSP